MKAQIKLGKIFGIEIGLHYSWLIIAALISLSLSAYFGQVHPLWSRSVIWSMAISTALLFFFAIVVHEFSHALVARAHGLPVRSITLFALGGVAQIEDESHDARTEFWLGIVGPITSLAIGLVCLGLARITGWLPGAVPATPVLAVLVWLGYINIALAVFNLFPGYPMDGGRVLRSIIWRLTGNPERATKTASAISQFMALGFIFFGLIMFFRGAGFGGLWIAFIGWFLLNAAKESYLQVEFTQALRGVTVGDLMTREFPVLDGNITLRNLVDNHLLKSGKRCFVIIENGTPAGIVTPHEIKNFEQRLWAFKTAADAMVPVAQLHAATPKMSVIDALSVIGRENVNQLPVFEDGKWSGIISREQIINYLFTRKELEL
jgi:Zn-dependent protease/predicted transcriptional regulator